MGSRKTRSTLHHYNAASGNFREPFAPRRCPPSHVTPIAFAAHHVMLDKDEVAFPKALAAGELTARLRDDADVFMPHDDRRLCGRLLVELHIGAADPGNFHLHQGAVFRNIRHRKLADLCLARSRSDGGYNLFQFVLLSARFYDGAVDKVTIPALQQMKRDGRKIVGVVAWDFQIAQVADRAGVEILSVGDSVGVNLWGHESPSEITLDEMIVVCKAVRRGTKRALVSCDLPADPVQQGVDSALRAAVRVVKEAGADMVKLDGAPEFPDTVRAIVREGIPVFAQFGLTPQTAMRFGIPYGAQNSPNAQATPEMTAKLVGEAKLLEDAGASLLDFTNSGPVAGAAVVKAVAIPVVGGFGGGPWLDGRVRLAHTAIGYGEKWLDSKTESYANVAKISYDAFVALIADVRAGRQIKG